MSATTAMADAYDRISHDIGVQAFARRMLYLNDVSKIEAACRNNYGKTPSRKWIERQLAEKNGKRVAHFYSSNDNVLKYSEAHDPGYYQPTSLIKPPKAKRKRDVIEIEQAPRPNPFTIRWKLTQAIIESVAEDFGITPAALTGKSRVKHLVHPRAIAAKLLMDSGISSAETGRRLGGRDHSTILHAVKNILPIALRDDEARAIYDKHQHWLKEAERKRIAVLEAEANA